MMALWKWGNTKSPYRKCCLCCNPSASSPKRPRFCICRSPPEGTALPPLDSTRGCNSVPSLSLPGGIWVQTGRPAAAPGLESPFPAGRCPGGVQDSSEVSDSVDRSVSWKPRVSRLAFQIQPRFVGTILQPQVFAFEMKCGYKPRGVNIFTSAKLHLEL